MIAVLALALGGLGAQVQVAAAAQGVEPDILAAIVQVESGGRRGRVRCVPARRGSPSPVTCDYGLAQVNDLWVARWRLDPARLRSDDSYTLAVAARILSDLRRRYGGEPSWWGRYHSATPKLRARYEARVRVAIAALRRTCPPRPCGMVASR